jgi:hypothetical protein
MKVEHNGKVFIGEPSGIVKKLSYLSFRPVDSLEDYMIEVTIRCASLYRKEIQWFDYLSFLEELNTLGVIKIVRGEDDD